MANRKFEMYEYRQILLRMRLGETDRALSKAGLMGRRKLGEVRRLAKSSGWLDSAKPLPDVATLAERLRPRCPLTVARRLQTLLEILAHGLAVQACVPRDRRDR